MPDNTESTLATLASVIQKGVNERLKDLHTAIPAFIEEFDPETQLAKVQPAIKRVFKKVEGDEETTESFDIPVLINVPVLFPRGGGFSLTFPVKKGDECLLVFCERSIDGWHRDGEVSDPLAMRFHSYSDAVAFVGISSTPNKIPNYDPDNVELKKDDDSAKIVIKDSEIDVVATTKVTVTAPDAEFSGNVLIKGNLTVEGDTTLTDTVTSGGKDISDTHKHGLVVTGTDDTGEVL